MTAAPRQQLGRIVDLLVGVLGSDLLGAYLHGSGVLGGLRPHSDLDVLAVSARPTTTVEKRRLLEALLDISSGLPPVPPLRPIELTIVVQSEVRPWRYPPRVEFQFGEWLRGDFEAGRLEPWDQPNPDLAPLIAMALRGNTPLLGPPPAAVLDPVAHDDVIRAITGSIDALLRDVETDTRNVILTLARIWMTIATGEITSKDSAASWALERVPQEHRAVVQRARAIYVGAHEERWDNLAPQVRAWAKFVAGRICAESAASQDGP